MLAPNKDWTINKQAAFALRNTQLPQFDDYCALQAIGKEMDIYFEGRYMETARALGWNPMQIDAVIKANDHHRWSFHKIADLVESFDLPQWWGCGVGKGLGFRVTTPRERRELDRLAAEGAAKTLAVV